MVDSAVFARGGLVKQRNLGKPRPLRSDPDLVNLSELFNLVEEVETGLSFARNHVDTRKKTQQLKELLRLNGQTMEAMHKDALDRLEVSMMDAVNDKGTDIVLRLSILEVIELRLNNWNSSPHMVEMYRQKLTEAHLEMDMKKIGYQGGNYGDKDWRKPNINHLNIYGLKNNVVKGTENGDAASSFLLEKSCSSEPRLEFSSSLEVNGHKVLVSSTSEHLSSTSKDVLFEYFSILGEADPKGGRDKTDLLSYEKEELLRFSKSPLCRDAPKGWEAIVNKIPNIAKKAGAPTKHFLRELELIKKQEAARRM